MGAGLDLHGRRRDGSRFPVDISLSILDTDHGRLVTAFVRDITERKRIEAIFHGLLEAASDAIVGVDERGLIKLVNRQTEILFGYDRQELVGRSLEVLLPERHRGVHADHRKRYSAHPRTRPMGAGLNLAGRRKDGTEFPLDIGLSSIETDEGPLVTAIVRDLTKVAEVEEAAQLLAAVVDSSDDAIVRKDLDGTILSWNAAAERLYGYTAEEAIGSPVSILSAPDGQQEIGSILERVSLGERVDHFDTIRIRKDGTPVPVSLSVSPVRGLDGRVVGAATIARDVTERKRVDALLEENRLELERSNLDLASFAHVASHDLQEPLRMVSGYVQLIADRYRGKLDADADDFIHFAVDGARRMQQLIRGILEYSRVGTAELAWDTVDTNELVADTVSLLGSTIERKHAEVTLETLPAVVADRTQLGQVFQNLISNSLKFISPGAMPRVRVSAAREADGWRFSVEDNGIGVDAGHAEQIFAPFKRLHTHAEYAGAGVGLAVCKRSIEHRGGRIWVAPAPTEGSVFSFTIPDRPEGPDVSHR
jgi:PAS domain S-box-containing protein